MTKHRYLGYGVAAAAGGVLALWAGLPPVFLLLLVCPVLMVFMMRGMGGMNGGSTPGNGNATKRPDVFKPDHSHERIDQP